MNTYTVEYPDNQKLPQLKAINHNLIYSVVLTPLTTTATGTVILTGP